MERCEHFLQETSYLQLDYKILCQITVKRTQQCLDDTSICTLQLRQQWVNADSETDHIIWFDGFISSSSIGFSRQCLICVADSPSHRDFFTECGHLICTECSSNLKKKVKNEDRTLRCPFCRSEGSMQQLDEAEYAQQSALHPSSLRFFLVGLPILCFIDFL